MAIWTNGLVDDVDVHFSHFKVACVLLEKILNMHNHVAQNDGN
jgi:hypothetical protein